VRPWTTLGLRGRQWVDYDRARDALLRDFDPDSRASAVVSAHAVVDATPPDWWTLWLDRHGNARAEFPLGFETLTVAVDGTQWESFTPQLGLRRGDATAPTGLGPGLLLCAGSAVLEDRVRRRDEWAPCPIPGLDLRFAPQLIALGAGADQYVFTFDAEVDVAVRAEAYYDGGLFRVIEVDEVMVDVEAFVSRPH